MNLPKPKPGYKWEKTIYQQYEEIPKEWDFVSISETGKIVGGGTPDTKNLEYWKNGDIPWFTPQELTKLESNSVKDSKRKITQKGLDESGANMIPENNILITTRATIGNCVINEKKAATNQGFLNLIVNKNHNNKFLMYSIRFNKRRLRQYSQGTTFLEISRTNFGKIKIPCPKDIREEEKIASILSNIDELIQKQQQVIEQTQKLMKGQMQKLLTKGIGHAKFKKAPWLYHQEIEIPKEWEVVTLDSVCDQIQDMDHKMPKKINKGIPFLSISHIVNKSEIDFSNPEYISEEDYSKFLKKIQPKKNDLLYSRVATIGEVRIIREEKKFAFTYNVVLIKAGKKINSLFLKYMLDFPEVKNHVKILAPQTAQPFLGLGDIQKIKILIPTQLTEQEKIASILSNLDSLIQQEKQYKEKLEKIKRGLMQQLLTGKTRVKV